MFVYMSLYLPYLIVFYFWLINKSLHVMANYNCALEYQHNLHVKVHSDA